MAEYQHLNGETEDELWRLMEQDLAKDPDPIEYRALLQHQGRDVLLDIDIDPGGGFEGGFETTSFSAVFNNAADFTFALHHEGFLDEVGKFFGMQDLEIGDAAFDAGVVVKASDETKIRALLANESLRATLLELNDFTFEIARPHGTEAEGNHSRLLLTLYEGVTDPVRLRQLYRAFLSTLIALDPAPTPA